MKMYLIVLAILINTLPPTLAKVSLESYRSGLIHPVDLVDTDTDIGILVAEQIGKITNIDNSFVLDLTDKTIIRNLDFDEGGLLAIEYRKGILYTCYDTIVNDAEVLRISSHAIHHSPIDELVILEIPQIGSYNKACDLFFDIRPEKLSYLYIAVGDNGGGVVSQDLDSFLGKILRIDVSVLPYGIPSTNPSLNSEISEIYAYGLRNPWRCDFSEINSIICGDPGTDMFEEINTIFNGGNYGWNFTEGNQCLIDDCDNIKFVKPLMTYETPQRGSIIGGIVTDPNVYPSLKGYYLFADFARGPLLFNFKGIITNVELDVNNFIFSFGKDRNNNIYILSSGLNLVDSTGIVYKLVDTVEEKERVHSASNKINCSIIYFIIIVMMLV